MFSRVAWSCSSYFFSWDPLVLFFGFLFYVREWFLFRKVSTSFALLYCVFVLLWVAITSVQARCQETGAASVHDHFKVIVIVILTVVVVFILHLFIFIILSFVHFHHSLICSFSSFSHLFIFTILSFILFHHSHIYSFSSFSHLFILIVLWFIHFQCGCTFRQC